jgi:hypothetical protein
MEILRFKATDVTGHECELARIEAEINSLSEKLQ